MRTKQPVIELGRSKTEAFRKLGLDPTGATNWRRIEDQLRRLSACRVALHTRISEPGRVRDLTSTYQLVEGIELWSSPDDKQLSLMPVKVVLGQKFLESLLDEEQALPLHPNAIAFLARRRAPLAMDIYTWWAHRLRRVQEPVKVPWVRLREQFSEPGSVDGENAAKNFKRRFLEAMELVRQVYPTAKVKPVPTGLALYPSPPPIAYTRQLPRKR